MAENELSTSELLDSASRAEAGNDPATAINLYKQLIVKDKLNEYAYDRLMILYRKQKDYKKELGVINNAVKAFEQFYKSKKSLSRSVQELSEKLNRSFGLIDKKGNARYEPQPIARWKKRKTVVEKKLSSS